MPLPIRRTVVERRRLTGRVKFSVVDVRTGFLQHEERIALLVEETFDEANYQLPGEPKDWVHRTIWRPAYPLDLASKSLRWIFDKEPEVEASRGP